MADSASSLLQRRRDVIRETRLYFVCEARPGGNDPTGLLDAACRGGVSLLQLRQKDELPDDELISAAKPFREVADRHGALFILNDRPDLVEACRADGVHVGQDDTPVEEAREIAGPDVVVGLSTHNQDQLLAAQRAMGAARPDQVSVGPVWATPTKPGRPATGLELLSYAAGVAQMLGEKAVPWFAIGGVDESNVADVVRAGAERAVIVRAIRDADDPEAVSRRLYEAFAGGGSA